MRLMQWKSWESKRGSFVGGGLVSGGAKGSLGNLAHAWALGAGSPLIQLLYFLYFLHFYHLVIGFLSDGDIFGCAQIYVMSKISPPFMHSLLQIVVSTTLAIPSPFISYIPKSSLSLHFYHFIRQGEETNDER